MNNETDERYEGEWLNDKRHGHGKITWDNERRHEGEFVNGMADGYGEYISKNFHYKGQFKEGRYHGKGETW